MLPAKWVYTRLMITRPSPRLSFSRFIIAAVAIAPLALTLTVGSQAASVPVAPPRVGISSSDSSVTIYGASWCSACRSLEGKLDQRRIPFSVIDVDKNREAYDRARKASGMGSAIPLTHITQNGSTWVQGDDADAVERAYKGE
jgi:mycoredoxin